MGVPYVPIVGLVGTSLLEKRTDMKICADPFDGQTLTVVAKALRPDVAVFHVQKADAEGNVSTGYASDNVLLAEASRLVIVTAEEIVERVTEKEAEGSFMPGIFVHRVVHAPFGAHPGACPGRYPVDKAHMADYVRASADDASFAAYLRRTVLEVPHHAAYVERFVPLSWRQPARLAAGD